MKVREGSPFRDNQSGNGSVGRLVGHAHILSYSYQPILYEEQTIILSCSPPPSSCFYLCVYDLTMASASAYSKDPSLLASTCHFEILYDYTCLILKIVLEVAFVVIISLLGRSWWRLRHIPGPFTAAVGFPRFCKFRDNQYSEVELEKLYYKYGKSHCAKGMFLGTIGLTETDTRGCGSHRAQPNRDYRPPSTREADARDLSSREWLL